MTATRDDIRTWLAQAKAQGASHLIIMHDTFDHENYPIYVKPTESARTIAHEKTGNMQRVEECYSMALDIETQLLEHRAFHYD